MENYNSLSQYLKSIYKEKVYKLAIDAGFSCPNRDGTCGSDGCIFCTEGGSGDFAKSDLKQAKLFLKNNENSNQTDNKSWKRKTKSVGDKFIAYYQSYSNTYATVERLKKIYQPAIDDDDIVCISIATRPDCLSEEICDLLSEINKIKPVWVELGLQTIHERTADFINRGYKIDVFTESVKKLRDKKIEVIVHLILGLPGEGHDDMIQSVRYLNDMDIQGIKLHLLSVLEGTKLGCMYQDSIEKNDGLRTGDGIELADGFLYREMSLDEYTDLICDCIGNLNPDIVVHRLTGDGPKKILLSPLWTADKKKVLNTINKRLKEKNITQGCLLNDSCRQMEEK